jgi:hypothetical protein
MKRILLSLAAMLTINAPAWAEDKICRHLTNIDGFIAHGVEALRSGRVRGAALEGDAAVVFMNAARFKDAAEWRAVFLLDSGKDRIMVGVHDSGGVCTFFNFDDATAAAVQVYFGTGI